MKFKVIIGNPPYQAPKIRKNENNKKGACGSTLWQDFVDTSFKILKDEGHMCLVHPSLWRKPENNLFHIFKNNNFKYLEMHCIKDGLKTFKASTAYDWYVLQKKEYEGHTVVKDVYGNLNQINLSSMEFIPSCAIDLFNKLVAKENEEKCNILFSYSDYETRKPWMSRTQTKQFKYPCFYMNTLKDGISFLYSSKNNGHFGIPKVIISENGAYLGTYNDYKGEYALTQFMFAIIIESKKEGDNIIKALKSNKFNEIWKASQWMSSHREWRMFKYFKKDFWKEFI